MYADTKGTIDDDKMLIVSCVTDRYSHQLINFMVNNFRHVAVSAYHLVASK